MGKSNEHVGSLGISAMQSVLEYYSWIRNDISHRSEQLLVQDRDKADKAAAWGGRVSRSNRAWGDTGTWGGRILTCLLGHGWRLGVPLILGTPLSR